MMGRTLLQFALLVALVSSPAWISQQQKSPQESSSKDSPGADSSSSSNSHSSPGPGATVPQAPANAASRPVYNPFLAEHDIEVGTFYMHKGDLDAAIGRFEDAIKQKPKYGKPRLLLAEIYEKKHDKPTALKYYKEYLQVYPDSPDAKKIRKKIDELSQE